MICAIAGCGLSAALPAAAAAAVYCVPDTTLHQSCEIGQSDLQTAINAAQGSVGEADTVRIAAGSFPVANSGYLSVVAGNEVQIIGAGVGQTKLALEDTLGNKLGFRFWAPAGSILSDLTLEIGANDDGNSDTGFNLGGSGVTREVEVKGPDATNATGVIIRDDSVLEDATVDLEVGNTPSNNAVRADAGNTQLSDSLITGDYGVNQFGGGSTITVERSRIRARVGLSLDNGSILAHNSLIDLGTEVGAVGVQAANFNNGTDPMEVTLGGSTIVGGGASSIGIQSVADSSGDGEDSTVAVNSSVIAGPATSIAVTADNDDEASVSTSYSNYTAPTLVDDDLDDAGATGTATLQEASRTSHADPGFINPAEGDYHLLADSPLVDVGDPSPPAQPALDIDGDPRAVDSSPDCSIAARRDIGADEVTAVEGLLDCIAPETTLSGKKKLRAKKKRAKVKFSVGSTEAGSTLECSLDKGAFAPCSASFSAKVKRGKHTLRARATDPSGNQDATPAELGFRVIKRKARRKS